MEINDTAADRTYWLPAGAIDAAAAKIAQINARAERKGLTGLWTGTSTGNVSHDPMYRNGSCTPDFEGEQPLYWTESHEFVVTGTAPKLAGWTFLASLSWEDGPLITRSAPGFTGRVDEATVTEGQCDHCNTNRDRKDTYLLENEAGTRVQVGSSCVKDFLGQDFSPSWANGNGISDLDEEFRHITGTPTAPALEVLATAACIAGERGWVSRAKADETGQTPSGDTLKSCLFPVGKADEQAAAFFTPKPEHREQAAKVLAWCLALEPGDSEYLANLKRAATAEWVTIRTCAILGSAVAAWHRENGEARVAKLDLTGSKFIGAEKDKLVLQVTLDKWIPIDGYYGTTHLYIFHTDDLNVVKWFSSRDADLDPGTRYELKGTVKGHEVRDDVNETVLTRCKLTQTAVAV